ncbi:alpha/beta-hydrolase [Colletotrichum zoysiae]|uniref:Alpha/beta-hydrolase n=1 Tax=Colletotrichum zoysiae TaxID=1216348 RepID=A0AAD9HE84_9PEZI|nr:alpha/beta-hydrolase [Colletotrichum zoysiae]
MNMDSLDHLILKEAPPLDPAWLAYEEEASLQAPKEAHALPLNRQPVYVEECRQLNARMLAPGALYHHLSHVSTQQLTTASNLDGSAIPLLRFFDGSVEPASKGEGVVVIYYHGGGLYVGEADSEELSCRRIVSDFAGATVYSVGYRLMPGFPASNCVSDSLDAFDHVRALHPSARKLVLVGSSSGGQLAATVSQLAPRGSFHGVVLRCPVTSDGGSSLDLVPERLRRAYTSASPSFVTSLLGVFGRAVPRDGLERMPLEAGAEELGGMPRTWVQVCSNDTLYSDGVCYAMALREAGAEVRVEVVRGWPHTFWLMAPGLARAVEAEREMVEGLIRFHDHAFSWGSKKNARAFSSTLVPASPASSSSEADSPNSAIEQLPNALNGSQAASSSSPETSNTVDSIEHNNGMTDEIDEKIQQLKEQHGMILQGEHGMVLREMSARAYIQLQTARKLRLLVAAAGF